MFEVEQEYTPFHDHSTASGKLRIIYQRFNIKWILLLIVIGFVGAVLLSGESRASQDRIESTDSSADAAENVQNENSIIQSSSPILKVTPRPVLFLKSTTPTPVKSSKNSSSLEIIIPIPIGQPPPSVSLMYTEKPSFWNGTFRFEGDPSSITQAPTFDSIFINKTQIINVELTNVTVDASAISKDLNDCTNLKSLILSNVYIVGEFDRVLLPNIEIFIIQQLANLNETKAEYQEVEKLKSRIFFDKTPTQNWDLKKDIANLGTKIEFQLNGVTLLKINQKSEEIILNIPFCEEILQSVGWTLSTLSLVTCNVSTSSIPTNLLYFNVYKVYILNGGNFTQIIKAFTRITDFYAQIPDEVINLSDFPLTLTTLTVIDTELDYMNDYHSSIRNLVVGYHLGSKILENIFKIMPSIQRVAVFGLPQETEANILLHTLIVNTTAHWIVMEEFKRNPNSNFPIQQWIEQYLTDLQIPETSENFLITLNRNGTGSNGNKSGRELTTHEINYYHYVLLGWYKTTTFEAYLAIQKRKLANLNTKLG